MDGIQIVFLTFALAMIVWGIWVLAFTARDIYLVLCDIRNEIEEKMLCEKH